EGISTALEVTDAQAVLTQAEVNVVNARYDYLLARARYERAIGAGLAAVPAGASTTQPAPAQKPGG
ncbi:MAG: TolC family protein, partial [Armatimonadota bacterium]|nr:TolC family protein [Armatimonadota bacterium]